MEMKKKLEEGRVPNYVGRVLLIWHRKCTHPKWYYLGPRYVVTTKAEKPPTKCTTYSEQNAKFQEILQKLKTVGLPRSHSQFLQVASASRPD